MVDDMDWLIIGDFNLIRRPSDRNKPGVTFRTCLGLTQQLATRGSKNCSLWETDILGLINKLPLFWKIRLVLF
jgi:hypothetical protein